MDFGRAAVVMTRSRPCSRSSRAEARSGRWVLDADLAGAFDRIAHEHILAMLGTFPARGMVARWLKAGVVEQGRLHRTEEGTPQGGVVSPVLLNVALHGMEQAAGVRYYQSGNSAGKAMMGSPVLIRYADDFVVHCHTRQDALEIKAKLAEWLAPRGLAFTSSPSRTASTSSDSMSADTAASCLSNRVKRPSDGSGHGSGQSCAPCAGATLKP
jgi:retron-type reverse transcriptase